MTTTCMYSMDFCRQCFQDLFLQVCRQRSVGQDFQSPSSPAQNASKARQSVKELFLVTGTSILLLLALSNVHCTGYSCCPPPCLASHPTLSPFFKQSSGVSWACASLYVRGRGSLHAAPPASSGNEVCTLVVFPVVILSLVGRRLPSCDELVLHFMVRR